MDSRRAFSLFDWSLIAIFDLQYVEITPQTSHKLYSKHVYVFILQKGICRSPRAKCKAFGELLNAALNLTYTLKTSQTQSISD